MNDRIKINKRDFFKKAGAVTAGAVGASTLAMPYVRAQSPIKWRLQTYAGPALAEHVCKPAIDAFNKAANGEMVIEMYTADQLVPQGELFRAVQSGTLDAAQSDDDSAAAPVDVAVFGAYFPFASRYSLGMVRPQGHLAGGVQRSAGRDLAERRFVGPLQLRHHQADPFGGGPERPACLHVPDRGALHAALRRGSCLAAL